MTAPSTLEHAAGLASTPPTDAVRQAEARKLEAERLKLELEAQEIERRLSSPWWKDQRLTQYLLALIITAALLFGWTRVYLEPMLRKQTELNEIAEKRNAIYNEYLQAENEMVTRRQQTISRERDNLQKETAILREDQEKLQKKQQNLELLISGLKIVVEREQKFFSILNQGDPINQLERYGWKMWSDNYFGRLGYYLIIEHPEVRAGKEIVVGRSFEVDQLKQDMPDRWRQYIEDVNARHGPLLALDYTYHVLYADPDASVGGMIYADNGRDVEFYAPLSAWMEKLSLMFSED